MEFWKFALTWKLICPMQHKIIQKRAKETEKEGGISSTIMGQRPIHNSIHKPQRSPKETLGFNQDDHPYRICNEIGIPEFLELQIPGIPMVVMVTSRARSLRNPTQQDFIHVRTLPIYKCHKGFKFWRTLHRTLCNIVYNQEGTPKMKRMLIFWEMRDITMSFTPIIPKTSHHTIHKVYFQEHNSLYPILWVTTRDSYSKRCDTFCQDCTFLEECIPRNTRDAYD